MKVDEGWYLSQERIDDGEDRRAHWAGYHVHPKASNVEGGKNAHVRYKK